MKVCCLKYLIRTSISASWAGVKRANPKAELLEAISHSLPERDEDADQMVEGPMPSTVCLSDPSSPHAPVGAAYHPFMRSLVVCWTVGSRLMAHFIG
jgi:hypothetical protein